jgi:hypothetical protein
MPSVLLQYLVARHNIADTVLRQLALEEPDKQISGHGARRGGDEGS